MGGTHAGHLGGAGAGADGDAPLHGLAGAHGDRRGECHQREHRRCDVDQELLRSNGVQDGESGDTFHIPSRVEPQEQQRTVISGGFLPPHANSSSVAVAIHHMMPTAHRNLAG